MRHRLARMGYRGIWCAGALAAAAVALSGCLGDREIKGESVMANFKKQQLGEHIVSDRNYVVGQRYRVEPGQVMIRAKLYTLAPESANAYRAEVPIVATGDGVRVDIAQGARLRIADRVLVNGKLANVVPLPAPPPGAPDVSAVMADDDGQLMPAVLRGGRIVTFAKFAVTPKNAQLFPEFKESVKTSAGYTNYEIIYHGYAMRRYESCDPPRQPGSKKPAVGESPPTECGSGVHLDLSVVQYDRLQLDRASVVNRTWYPVRADSRMQIASIELALHEVTPTSMVFAVTRDDYAFRAGGF